MSEFCGHPVGVLSSKALRLEYLTDVGPRIALLLAGRSEASLLTELPEPGSPKGSKSA